MLRNYLKIALRNLVKNKVYSFINIGGLAMGMSVAMLIGLWIYDELSFNKYHKNYDKIGQVLIKSIDNGEIHVNKTMSLPIGLALNSSYGRDFKHIVMASNSQEHIVSEGIKNFNGKGRYMQANAPEMLTLNIESGSSKGLKDLNSILLSSSFAKMIFGDAPPLNRIVRIDNNVDVQVVGVYSDLPSNSEFNDLNYILPWDLLMFSRGKEWYDYSLTQWNSNFLHIYVQLAENVSFEQASFKIKNLKRDNMDAEYASNRKPEVFIYPMKKWNLYSKFENGVGTSEKLQSIKYFGIIGIFVLLLACINFINLSTARSEKRAKEVGIRKTVGSVRGQLITQFLSEAFLTAILALLASIVIVILLLPWFNNIAEKEISFPFSNILFWLASIGFTIIVSVLSGLYPAFYLSAFKPVKVLKGAIQVGRFSAIPRKVLVVTQFSVSIVLIIGTIVVFRQIQFSQNRPIGFESDGLIYFDMKTDDIHKHHQVFHDELMKTGVVENMAESDGTINELWSNNTDISWKGKNPNEPLQTAFGTIGVSHEFGNTVGWKFVRGRDFSKTFNDSNSVVVNEFAVKFMGLKNPIGETIQRGDIKKYTIVGVIKDVLMENPFEPVSPTMFFLGPWNKATVSIKIKPSISTNEALLKIESVFKKYAPSMPFEFKFADEEFAKKFASIERVGKLTTFFAILAIFISCLGLFGLASFVAEQRTKEIGIRKVLGATVANLWQLLSKDFVVLVIISCLIAAPIAYYFMSEWLQKYTYRTEISWWIFVVAGVGALVITLLTVSYQAIKAALM
ncbi:MAG: ABC transporter permease, partial [Cytophagales bacterium]